MKKSISVISIFLITLSLVAISAAPISFAESRQNAPVPRSQQPPPRTEVQRAQQPKTEFWDLAVDHCMIHGEFVDMSPCDFNSPKSISVNVGQTVNFRCYYNIITIPVINITKADAVYWGSGNLTYKNLGGIVMPQNGPGTKDEMKSLPHFTWGDVSKWQTSMKQGMADVSKWQTSKNVKVWKDDMMFTWTPTEQQIGTYLFLFHVDAYNVINEVNGPTENNFCFVEINVNP